MELQEEMQKEKYRHSDFLERVPIKEEKLLKLFLRRDYYPIEVE